MDIPKTSPDNAQTLRITEIFLSIQGESTRTGRPTVFVRTTGCPLRCGYCDTVYAFSGGTVMSFDAIVDEVKKFGVSCVTVTGGEPLAQNATFGFLARLCDLNLDVSLETSGAVDVALVDERVMKVIDVKTPGSGEVSRNLWSNLNQLGAHDQLKFVICDRADYEWSRDQVHAMTIDTDVEILFSPSHEQLEARILAEWVLADALDVRLQIQLHKYLWGDEPGR